MLYMLNVVGNVSEEALLLRGFGCLNNSQHGGPIEGVILPMAPRTLWRRSGIWAKASSNMCFEGIVTAAMQALVVGVGNASRIKALVGSRLRATSDQWKTLLLISVGPSGQCGF